MFVIDNTTNMRRYPSHIVDAFNGFNYRLAASKPDIRIAAIRHGHFTPQPGGNCASWWRGLIGRRAPFSNAVLDNGADSHLLFDFLSPRTSNIPVNSVRRGVTGDRCLELFYISLERARQMIEQECRVPPGGTRPSHCHNKAIIVLGDGVPGLAPGADLGPFKFPDILVRRLNGSSVKVHAVCIDRSICNRVVQECKKVHIRNISGGSYIPYFYHLEHKFCPSGYDLKTNGGTILGGMRSRTGGEYKFYSIP